MIEYIKQSPIIPLVLSGLVVVMVLMQSLIKRRFLLIKLLISFLLTFMAAMVLVFFGEIQGFEKDTPKILIYIGMLVVDVADIVLLFTIFDVSLTN